ncbi:hypothetical protein C0134_04255 [Moraxella catarrhalis]|nr:hypothetical protein MCR_1671 [Moraxella catarrhalis BBH18]AVL50196.1 hypothetical protein CEP83_03860 [Moraxella catarrhalis]EGE17280.1 hypothetical protein E9Q_07444 [Moraxella catarrhalis BC1]EGE22325.1 hypothetical protein E9U_01121 [Moraxella catarrhalis BC8]AXT93872.1 hypothetical protein SP69_07460 [Moraxella catarrhalis]
MPHNQPYKTIRQSLNTHQSVNVRVGMMIKSVIDKMTLYHQLTTLNENYVTYMSLKCSLANHIHA